MVLSTHMIGIPFGKPIMLSVLAFAAALGGYGGYTVLKDGDYGAPYLEGMYTVVEVIDGDTFKIDNDETVRLIGIDAPEMGDCYGETSKKALMRLLLDMKVELRKDEVATDKYNRLLRYVYLHNQDQKVDSIFVNKYMIERGHAKSYLLRENDKHHLSFTLLENKANKAKKGMWRGCDYKTDRELNKNKERYYTQPSDPKCIIKGNISDGNKKYFTPRCPNYKRVQVESHKDEAWFCTEKEAKKAGFVKSGGCK